MTRPIVYLEQENITVNVHESVNRISRTGKQNKAYPNSFFFNLLSNKYILVCKDNEKLRV